MHCFQRKPAQRVVEGRVEAGRDQNQVGGEAREHSVETCQKLAHVVIRRETRGKRQVQGRPRSGAGTRFLPCAGPRVEGALVHGKVENGGILVKDFLGAVPVVDVPIHDEYAFREPRAHRVTRGDGHVVEQTEAHRPVRRRMVARWPDCTEGRADLSLADGIHGAHHAPGRRESRIPGGSTDPRIGIHFHGSLQLRGLLYDRFDSLHVLRLMDQGEQPGIRGLPFPTIHRRAQLREHPVHGLQEHPETTLMFGMVPPGVVPSTIRVLVEGDPGCSTHFRQFLEGCGMVAVCSTETRILAWFLQLASHRTSEAGSSMPSLTAGVQLRLGRPNRTPRLATLSVCLLAATACDVEWGGARLALENPAPIPEPVTVAEEAEALPPPLPDAPLLYLVRIDPAGNARVVPAAQIAPRGGPPGSLEIPSPVDDAYRARFDSAFLRPGTELAVQRWGRRIGTVILGSVTRPADPACLSVAEGTALLVPGSSTEGVLAAVPLTLSAAPAARVSSRPPARGMVLAAPVLAERLIGGSRAYLARRVSLQPVLLRGDTVSAMAATYLVSDSLAPGAPSAEAISLFYLAIYKPTRGYSSVWEEIRRYGPGGEKEAFEYLDWIRLSGGHLHLLRRFDNDGEGLAAGFVAAGDDEAWPEVEWRETGPCRSLELLSPPDP